MSIILYKTEFCPKCKMIIEKLNSKGLEYTCISDPETVSKEGIEEVPVLEVDGKKLYNIAEINKWIKEQ